jgi:hypothetical protein
MLKRAKYYHKKLEVNPHPKRMAAWFPSVKKWPEDYLSEERPLRVYFMNECPQSWQCTVNPEVIMKFLAGSWTQLEKILRILQYVYFLKVHCLTLWVADKNSLE